GESKESKKSPPRESKKFKELPLGELRVQRITTRKIKSPKESPGESKESTNRRIKSPKESLGEEKEFTTRSPLPGKSKESKIITQRIKRDHCQESRKSPEKNTRRIKSPERVTRRIKSPQPGESEDSSSGESKESTTKELPTLLHILNRTPFYVLNSSNHQNLGESKESRTIGIIEKDHHWVNRKNPPLGESKSPRITGGSLWTLLILRKNQKSPQRTTSTITCSKS
ncbi:11894_t:CDS:2, partial [Ambispora leptoticha]